MRRGEAELGDGWVLVMAVINDRTVTTELVTMVAAIDGFGGNGVVFNQSFC